MSIVYFPELYEDELIYSVLARYYAGSSYIYYKDVVEDLFLTKVDRVEKEFLKHLKPEVIKILSHNQGIETLIENHTMYRHYGRFIDSDRRNIAYEALKSMDGDFSKLFAMPQNRKSKHRFFKYCPICSLRDRQHGETYYHCSHQMRGLSVCPEHGCYLINSSVALESTVFTNLITAEQAIPENEELRKSIIYCKNPIEWKLAQYMFKVFKEPIDRNNKASVSDLLHHKIIGTPYLSTRGEKKYHYKLWEDMKEYYQAIPEMEDISDNHIQRTLSGNRFVYYEVCMVAMFLNISVEELTKMQIPSKTPNELFDEKVKKLLDSGMGINATARKLGVGSSMIRLVIDHYENPTKKNYQGNTVTNALDWETLDKEHLPLVKQAIKELHGNGTERPNRVSIYAVSKKLKIASHRLVYMKSCNEEIERHRETTEQYRARKIIWCVHKLEREEKPIKCWRITAATKLEKEEIKACIPCLEEMDMEIADIVKATL